MPRTKRYLAAGLAIAVALVGGGIATVSLVGARQHERACNQEGERVRSGFDTAKRAAIERAFHATGSPFAAESFERTAAVLADYRDKLAREATANTAVVRCAPAATSSGFSGAISCTGAEATSERR